MIDVSRLALFLPTAFFISITPGMCMTLSLTLGLTVGLRRTFWMMGGELVGVGLVAVSAGAGAAAVMMRFPDVFTAFKWLGGAYLAWLGVEMWRSRGRMALGAGAAERAVASRSALAVQGFVTAVANPKGWAFFITLLPPFLDGTQPLAGQIAGLVAVLLTVEFFCLVLYAGGGRTMRRFLEVSGNVRLMNRVAGTLMLAVGAWLAFG